MLPTKADIITRLQRDILPLQGFKPVKNDTSLDIGLGPMKYAFPNAIFPQGAIHEFICDKPEDSSCSSAFIAVILSALMRKGGAGIWISSSRKLFPPALSSFGIEPDKIIFIDLQKEKQVLWAMEEALKCNGLAAVVGEVQELN